MEAPTAVTDKFPPEIYGDNLLKTLKQTFFSRSSEKLHNLEFSR